MQATDTGEDEAYSLLNVDRVALWESLCLAG
jgi:hypothetical protein